jgi:uncharacterized protein YchJ
MLDGKYLMMMSVINSVILSRLQNSTIPFDIRNEFMEQKQTDYSNSINQRLHCSSVIEPNNPCPCGSGKKFCECHGNNTRRNNRDRRRV